jgi:hypothetical protein
MNSQFNLHGLLLGIVLSTFAVSVSTQTLEERLRHPPDTKLIIVHADDLGETQAVNAATIPKVTRFSFDMGRLQNRASPNRRPWASFLRKIETGRP